MSSYWWFIWRSWRQRFLQFSNFICLLCNWSKLLNYRVPDTKLLTRKLLS